MIYADVLMLVQLIYITKCFITAKYRDIFFPLNQPGITAIIDDNFAPALKEKGYSVLPLCVCRFVCPSVRLFVHNKFLAKISQQLLITDALNFNALFV